MHVILACYQRLIRFTAMAEVRQTEREDSKKTESLYAKNQ